VSDDEARAAVEALVGRDDVYAEDQDGERYRVSVERVEGGAMTLLAPRMKVGSMDTLTLRFPHQHQIWQAAYGFGSAEYHSDELARVELELRAIEPVSSGDRAERTPQHALGKLRVIEAKHVLPRNEYPITVEDTSDTGLRFSCDFDVAVGDVFTLTVNLQEGLPLHVRASAVEVEPAAFGRKVVRARIEIPG
jgi:hypothetical protein